MMHLRDLFPKFPDTLIEKKIDSINKSLSEFNGKIISIRGYRQDSIGISGIEFETLEDLIFFKLKFN